MFLYFDVYSTFCKTAISQIQTFAHYFRLQAGKVSMKNFGRCCKFHVSFYRHIESRSNKFKFCRYTLIYGFMSMRIINKHAGNV